MYLGIDLGTSSVKVVLMNNDFVVCAQTSVALSISRPKPLWSEQNPEEWWQATNKAVFALKKNHRDLLTEVKAIGLSGQMHGAILLDKNGKVLRPAILWNDGRASKQCDLLTNRVPDIEAISCNKVMPGFTAPKVLWVKEHEPEVFSQIDKILLPKDYLRYRMSGDFASDMSDSSGTSWLDVKNRKWSTEILQACDLTEKHMPTLYEGNQITGEIFPELATEWGIPANTKIVAGGGDNAAGAISMNVIAANTAFISLGTSGVYFVASDKCTPNTARGVHTMAHCVPNTWHSMNCHLSATNCLNWLMHLTNASLEQLVANLEQHQTKEPLLFLPYLSGERSPLNNAFARGMFFGLSHETTREDMTQAILEGIAFNFKDGQDALQEANVVPDKLYVVGGGAKSLYWGKILAAILNKELYYCENADVGGALGAARLAYLGMNDVDPAMAFPQDKLQHIIKPDPNLVEHYQMLFPVFKKLYSNNKQLFNDLYNTEE